jgi:hypothetical protein
LSELRKAVNRHEIFDRAEKIEPKVRGLFEMPDNALPPAPESAAQSSESEDQEEYFWERFWADAEVVSVAYFQEIYARILAGQVKSPGAFSLRTLDIVRCLDERTANLFAEVCQYELGGFLIPAIFEPGHPFSVLELNALDDAGLLRTQKLETSGEPHSYSYGPWLIRVKPSSLPSGLHPLTIAGREILGLTPVEYTEARAIEVCRTLSTVVAPCEICLRSDGQWMAWGRHFGLKPDA